jgi:outer membrane protein OmpA-like peptidoglycan-associated protein
MKSGKKKNSPKSSLFFLFFLLFSLPPAHTQESPWYRPFFVEGSVVHYHLPELFSGFLKPQPGFRGALGYEYRRFRFSLESGYTHIEGVNPLVQDIKLVPLAAKAGYYLPLKWGLGFQADLSFGVFFSRTLHYETVIDMLTGKIRDERAKSLFAGARLYATYTFPLNFIKLYAGGGVDMVLETDGPIPPPVIEAGISIKPFALFRPKTARRKTEVLKIEPAELIETEVVEREIAEAQAPQDEIPEAEIAEAEIPEAEIAEPEIPELKAPEKIIVFSSAVYFRADSAAVIEGSRPVLDEAGRRLRANSALRITLRGYTAPSGTQDSITALSAARSWYCAEYLMRYYGIAEQRMSIEFYGAEETPEQKPWELRRRVDLIIEQGDDL